MNLVDTLGNSVVVNDLETACPSCGANSYVLEIVIRSFHPIVGVCKGCGNAWSILRGTHAFKAFKEAQRGVEIL